MDTTSDDVPQPQPGTIATTTTTTTYNDDVLLPLPLPLPRIGVAAPTITTTTYSEEDPPGSYVTYKAHMVPLIVNEIGIYSNAIFYYQKQYNDISFTTQSLTLYICSLGYGI